MAGRGLGKSKDYATVGFRIAELFTVLVRAAERRIGEFNAQDRANTAWPFAKAGFPTASGLKLLATAAERRMGDFNALGLANTAWAFAKAG